MSRRRGVGLVWLSMARLFCLDTVMMDITMTVATLPTSGSDVLSRNHLVATGGGRNAMSAASRQGLMSVYAGRLGTGPFSDLAREQLDADAIAAPVEPDEERDLGFCVVFVEPTGERSFVTARGSEMSLRPRHLETLGVDSGDVVLVSGYNLMYPVFAEMVLGWLGQLDGVEVMFDPATRVADIPREYLGEMLRRCDWLLCNGREANVLGGEGDFVSAASRLQREYECGVVVRHGADGCAVAESREPAAHVEGFLTEVVDANGAGDVHNGVFVAEWVRSANALSSARRANAAAAMSIARLGPARGPSREELDTWLQS